MKKLLTLLMFCLISIIAIAQVRVSGYYRKNGTYVQPHYRSSPDGNPYNNYSYPGNTNPYTGKVATGNPETYVNNHYNKSGRYSLKEYSGANIGAYVQFAYDLKPWIFYNVYDDYGKQLGSIGINNETNNVVLYNDKDKVVDYIQVGGFNSITKSTPSYNDNFKSLTNTKSASQQQTQTSAINSNENSTTYNTSENNHFSFLKTEKIYLKNENGNYNGFYMVITSKENGVTKAELYSNIDDLVGYIVKFDNGEEFIYDIFKKLVKHKIPKK